MNKVAIMSLEQPHDDQAAELADYAAGKGFMVVEVIRRTHASVEDRTFAAGTNRLLRLAAAREIDKVLLKEDIYLLGYNAPRTLSVLNKLHSLGVSLMITRFDQESLEPDGNPSMTGDILISILFKKIAAAVERRKAIKAGVAEARRKGRQIGRPAGTTKDTAAILKKYPKVVKGLKGKLTVRDTARLCGVSVSTVQKIKNLL